MATKNFKIDPTTEEILYVLRARRHLAPVVLRILASLERHHFGMAEAFLRDAIAEASTLPPASDGDFLEALSCSDAMETWRLSLTTESDTGPAARSAAPTTRKSESTATPNADTAAA